MSLFFIRWLIKYNNFTLNAAGYRCFVSIVVNCIYLKTWPILLFFSRSSSIVFCSVTLFLSTNHQYIHFLMRLIIGRMFWIAFFIFTENSFAVVLCSLVFVRGNEEDILAWRLWIRFSSEIGLASAHMCVLRSSCFFSAS